MMIRRIGKVVLVEFDSLQTAKSFYKFLKLGFIREFKKELLNHTSMESEQ